MIADGVAQGYTEARVAARVWKASGGKVRRGWASSGRRSPVRRGQPDDWVGGLTTLAGALRGGSYAERSADPSLARSSDLFRADIAAARAEAIAYARRREARA